MVQDNIEIEERDAGISICITAYKAVDTLKETLDSVIAQTWFKKYNNWEILLGIDSCEETLEYTKTIMNNYKNLRVFMMDSNKGTYVTSNTLFKLAKYENLLRFDSDDVMFSCLVEELMKHDEYDVQRFRLVDMKNNKLIKYFSWGQHFIKKEIFEKFGGYRSWPCAGDAEFMKRIVKFVNVNLLDKPLFLYRTRPGSLTHSKETHMKSKTRAKLIKFINESKYDSEEEAKIECVTNTYTEIFSDIYNEDPEAYMNEIKPIVYIKNKPNIIKLNPAFSATKSNKVKRAASVKIICRPMKKTVIAEKVKIINE